MSGLWGSQNGNYLGRSTWVNRGNLQSADARVLFSDVAYRGADMRYDTASGLWLPIGGTLELAPGGMVPRFLQPSGTVGANGALSLLATALPITSGWVYLYFATGKLYSGSIAGFYLASLSSGTDATVYNNRYTGGVPVIPASPTPIVDSGPGAYIQVTGVSVTALSLPIVAGLVGPDGSVVLEGGGGNNGSAGVKTFTATVGNNTAFSATSSSTQVNSGFRFRVANRGNVALNSSGNAIASGAFGFSSTAMGFNTTDFASAQTIDVGLQLAVATDYVYLSFLTAQVRP